jgi:hypothetical protein
MSACAHCGAEIAQARSGSRRRFCSPRCRQAGYRRRSERLCEDLTDLEPGGARRLGDRQIVATCEGGGARAWVELYRELIHLGRAALGELDGLADGQHGADADLGLMAAERRRLRGRLRFWAGTVARRSRTALRA